MIKTKTIQFRASDTLYDKVEKAATEEGMSISNLARKRLEKSFEEPLVEKKEHQETFKDDPQQDKVKVFKNIKTKKPKNPFSFMDFTQLIAWMYYKKRTYYEFNIKIEEVYYFFKILERHINNLDPEFKVLFDKVYIDLDRIVNNNNNTYWTQLKFNSGYGNNCFDYNKFEELMITKRM